MAAPVAGDLVAAGAATRFKAGPDPRRQGPVSAAEREFRDLVDRKHTPQADALLTKIFDAGMGGDMKAAELFFKVCGLIRRPTDDAAILKLAQELLSAMIERRRQELEGDGDR